MFTSKSPTPPPLPVTGIDVLRKVLVNRSKTPHSLTAVARDMETVGVAALDAFANGANNLSRAQLEKLTSILYPHAILTEDGMLKAKGPAKPPVTMTHPPKFVPNKRRYTIGSQGPGPQSTVPSKSAKAPDGWINSLLGR